MNRKGGLLITTGRGNFLETGTRIDVPCVVVLNENERKILHTEKMISIQDAVMSNGRIWNIEEAVANGSFVWNVNKAGVEMILREFVDNQQGKDAAMTDSIGLREDIVYSLLEKILENHWWDTFDGLKKQGVAAEYQP